MPSTPFALRILPALVACALAVPREACAQSTAPEAIDEPARAADLAGVGAFAEAAEALERAAPRLPPERALTAWANAVRIRRALGDERIAAQDRDAALVIGATSDPLRSRGWAILEAALSGCWLAPATAPPGSDARLREAAARLGDRPLDVAVRSRTARAQSSQDPAERRRLGVEALARYYAAHPDEAPGAEREVPDPLGALRLEQRRAAAAERRRMRRTGSPFGGMTEAGVDRPEGFYERSDDELLAGTPDERALQGAATARLLVLETEVTRASPLRPATPSAFPSHDAYDRWVGQTVTPWLYAWQGALHTADGGAARVEGMGVASRSARVFLLLAERYGQVVKAIRTLPGRPDVPVVLARCGGCSFWYPLFSVAREGFLRCLRGGSISGSRNSRTPDPRGFGVMPLGAVAA